MNTKNSTNEAVRTFAMSLAPVEPFIVANVLAFGTRAAVDQALTRLTKEGVIKRVTRGTYMRPGSSKYVAQVLPSAVKMIKAIASHGKEIIEISGAQAAMQLGLSTQVPANQIFLTTGSSRILTLGKTKIFLRHQSPSKFVLAGTMAGQVLRALEYHGPREVTTKTLILLQSKFSMPNRHHMAFKGGTSLSKVFSAISRFSEDVDITIDHKSLDPNTDPFVQGLSGNAKKRISEDLDQRAKDYIANIIAPHFKERLDKLHLEGVGKIRVSDDVLYIDYPSVLEDTQNYVQGSVKLEFGGKNAIVPNDKYTVTSILSKNFTNGGAVGLVDRLTCPTVWLPTCSGY